MDYAHLIEEIKHLEQQLREARAEARALAVIVDDLDEELRRLNFETSEE